MKIEPATLFETTGIPAKNEYEVSARCGFRIPGKAVTRSSSFTDSPVITLRASRIGTVQILLTVELEKLG